MIRWLKIIFNSRHYNFNVCSCNVIEMTYLFDEWLDSIFFQWLARLGYTAKFHWNATCFQSILQKKRRNVSNTQNHTIIIVRSVRVLFQWVDFLILFIEPSCVTTLNGGNTSMDLIDTIYILKMNEFSSAYVSIVIFFSLVMAIMRTQTHKQIKIILPFNWNGHVFFFLEC